ncbi:MAG TPA: response regulator, partial [Chloroflexota bacterium]|nr:response regulator [Chloroflexota bacterium]
MDRYSLAQHLRDALAHLHDVFYLEAHPLATVLADREEVLSGEGLRQLLLAAIDEMKPRGPVGPAHADWRRYQHLVLRYLDGNSVEQIERKLQVSARQASRDHQQAIDLLANHFLLQVSRRQVSSSPPSLDPPARAIASAEQTTPHVHEEPDGDSGDAELLETLQGVLRTLRKLVHGHAVGFDLSVPDTLPPVAVPPVALRQALLHLLMDAVERGGRGAIRIAAADRPVGVCLSIDVTPVDLAAAPKDARTPSNDSSGDLFETGRQLLEAHHGAVERVYRDGPTAGLEVVLPPSRQTTVLVIDDNPDVVELFRRFLRGEPYRVVQATNGEIALQLAETLQPEIIILDVVMPRQDGWDILANLQSLLGDDGTPVVICSVLAERTLADSLGATDFLAKPVTRQALLLV